MRNEVKYCLWLIIAIACCQVVVAQNSGTGDMLPSTGQTISSDNTGTPPDSTRYAVGEIIIVGNKKTKAGIILREIPFKTGEEYPLAEIVKKFEDARRQLMNTSLFHIVTVSAKKIEENKVDVLVEVKERWYLFPVPYFKPVDRNINQWIIQQKANLSRVNYGAKLLWNNTTGRNDKLRVLFLAGYTKQFSFSYDRPYIDKKLNWGLNMGFAIGTNHEVNYNTIDNKQAFLKNTEDYIRNFANAHIELTYRRAIKTKHSFGIGYTKEYVDDTVLKLNPSYFKSARNKIEFPEIYYSMLYYDLDYIPYPTKGYAVELSIGKKGLNNIMNLWQLSVKASGSWHVFPKSFFNLNVFGSIKTPFNQPYFNQRFLGYGDVFQQGYEYYVVDGVAGGYTKATLTRELFGFNIKTPRRKGKEGDRVPFKFYGKIFGNAGYVHNPQAGENSLANKVLFSGGIGLDIFTFYDVTLKIEWSFNQLGQNGVFLHRKSIF